jgi:hypothetical protein
VYGDYKLKQIEGKPIARTRISTEIELHHHDLLSLIITETKYPIDWVQKLGIVDFYTHIRLIEKQLKQRSNGNK